MKNNAYDHTRRRNAVYHRFKSQRIAVGQIFYNSCTVMVEKRIYYRHAENQQSHIYKIVSDRLFTFKHRRTDKTANERNHKTQRMHKKAGKAYCKNKIYKIYKRMKPFKLIHFKTPILKIKAAVIKNRSPQQTVSVSDTF
jgi:hypothetical protein